MTLTKKIVFALAPLLVVCGVIGYVIVYPPLKNSLVEKELAALSYRTEEAASIYRTHHDYANQHLYSLEESGALREFIRDDKDGHPLAAIGMARSLQLALDRILGNTDTFASIAILDASGAALYYHENSDDPFSSLSSTQRDLAKSLFAHASLNSHDIYKEGDFRRIVNSTILDKNTARAPASSKLDSSVIVQVAVCLRAFEERLVTLSNKYQAIVYLDQNHPILAPDALYASSALDRKHQLTIVPSEQYLLNKLQHLNLQIVGVISIGLFIVALLTMFIVRKFGTRPIEQLSREIGKTDIDNWGRGVITGIDRKDEVGILANRFTDLMSRLSLEHQKTEHLARIDSLTQLDNRQSFADSTNAILELADRQIDKLSTIYIDLDNFKYVNDRHGHSMGDALLINFADRISKLLNADTRTAGAVIGRLAGDEFAITLPLNSGKSTVEEKAQQILAFFNSGYHFEKGTFPITASIGIASYPNDGTNATELISSADAAMYQAKELGKNSYNHFSSQLAISNQKKHDIENALKTVDMDEEFHLVYMPICDEQRRIVSCEALLRWQSKEHGDIPPVEFIAIAEATGLFRKLDHWVIEQALGDFPMLNEMFGEHFNLAINLSSAELESNEIVTFLEKAVRDSNIEPSRIELELTETFATTEGLRSIKLLDRLVAIGFQISIDDFGSGHTSLLQLIDYPVHKIKFDCTFVSKLMSSSRFTILEPLIKLCHSQGFLVTAEGIENELIAKFFGRAGCDYFQGYFYCKPKTLQELTLAYPRLGQHQYFQHLDY